MTHHSYNSLDSGEALALLEQHYDVGAGLYKLWASPGSVLAALLKGWRAARHPAQLHYAWDLQQAHSLDAAICRTTIEALQGLALDGVEKPNVLDAGCGIGGAASQVAQIRPDSQVVGMSIVRRQIEIARMRAAALGVGNAVFCHGSYLQTGYPDDSFDGIYAIESFCYTPTDQKPRLLAEMFRVLRPGRRLVIIDGYSRREPATPDERRTIQDVLDGWTMPMPAPASQMRAVAEGAGFEVVHIVDATPHVIHSASRIAAIGTWVLRPLAMLARVPGMAAVLSPLGFASPAGAARFADACVSQHEVLRSGLGGYFVQVLAKPARTLSPAMPTCPAGVGANSEFPRQNDAQPGM